MKRFNELVAKFIAESDANVVIIDNLKFKYKEVNGVKTFDCDILISYRELENIPDEFNGAIINGDFWCSGNKLKTLENCPKYVKGDFKCSFNELTTLQYCPEKVGGWFECDHNAKQFTKDDILSVCKVNPLDIFVG